MMFQMLFSENRFRRFRRTLRLTW